MIPFILWSEGVLHISIKIDLESVENEDIEINNTNVIIKIKKDDNYYDIKLDLLHEINSQESYYNNYRNIEIYLKKSNTIKWGQLTKEKDPRICVDWSKQILDDEEIFIEELSDEDINDLDYNEDKDIDYNIDNNINNNENNNIDNNNELNLEETTIKIEELPDL